MGKKALHVRGNDKKDKKDVTTCITRNVSINLHRRLHKATFKNKNPRKSMYIAQGYKGLKAVQGYRSDYVNFSYSNQLRNQFGTRLATEKNLVVLKLDTINANKTQWLEEKYGKQSFKHTEAEKDFFAIEVTKKLINYLGA